MSNNSATVHATAVLAGPKALLIRGPAGSGKSRLALRLLQGAAPFARLIGDDRVHLEPQNGRLLVRPAAQLAGLIEVRGLGIVRMPFEALAVAGMVVDLGTEAERVPDAAQLEVVIAGVVLPRLALPIEGDPLPAVLAAVRDWPATFDRNSQPG